MTYKIVWNTSGEVYAEYQHYGSYLAAVERLPEQVPYDIDNQGCVTVIDDGDPYIGDYDD